MKASFENDEVKKLKASESRIKTWRMNFEFMHKNGLLIKFNDFLKWTSH